MSSDRKDKSSADPRPYEAIPLESSAARDNFSDTLNRVSYKKERVVIRRHGKDVAAVVPIEDLQFLEKMEDRLDLEEALAALKEAEGEELIPWERVKKDLGLKGS